MPEIARSNIAYDVNATPIHAINSQLLGCLFGKDGWLRTMLVEASGWIINALYATTSTDTASSLRTSSTLHRDRLYDHRGGLSDEVKSIDEVVTLPDSVSGRALLSGRPIWLSNSDLGRRRDKFGQKYYRNFSLVDVDTDGYRMPRIEIVFPIVDRSFCSSSAVGAVNLEFFGGESPSNVDTYLADVPRESINELCGALLSVHAPYLKVASGMANAGFATIEDAKQRADYVRNLEATHAYALARFVQLNRSAIDAIQDELASATTNSEGRTQ